MTTATLTTASCDDACTRLEFALADADPMYSLGIVLDVSMIAMRVEYDGPSVRVSYDDGRGDFFWQLDQEPSEWPLWLRDLVDLHRPA